MLISSGGGSKPRVPPPPPPPKKAPPPKPASTSSGSANAAEHRLQSKPSPAARQHAEKTRKKAEQSVKTSAASQRTAQKSARQAQTLRQRRNAAKTRLDHTSRSLERSPRLNDKQRKELQSRSDAAKMELQQIEQPLADAEKQAKVDRRRALDTANQALRDQRVANDAAAKAGQKKPFALADKVTDVFDAGSLSKKDQEKLFGEKSQVTPQEAARADVKRVEMATRHSPASGAKEIEAQLKHNSDPKYRAELIKGSKEPLYDIGQSLYGPQSIGKADQVKDTTRTLARITDELPSQQSRQLLDGVASGVNYKSLSNEKDVVEETIKDELRHGKGAFGVEFAAALNRQGEKEGAQALSSAVLNETREIRKDFEDKSKKVDALNSQLTNLVAGFGPSMSAKEQQKAIQAFKDRHEKEYKALEGAAQQFEGTLEASKSALQLEKDLPEHTGKALHEEAGHVVKQMPAFAETEHGQKVLQQAVQRQSEGKPSLLDNLEGMTSKVKDGNDVLGKMSGAVAKSTAQLAAQYKARGNDAAAGRIFDTLEKNHALFGVTQGDMEGLSKDFKTLLDSKPGTEQWKQTQASLKNRFGEITGDLPGAAGANERGVGALRGLGAFAGLVGAAKNWQDIAKGEGNSEAYLKAVGDTLNGAGDGTLAMMEMLNTANSSGALKALIGSASGVGGFVSAIGDGLAAVDAFKDGEKLKGYSKSASAVGGAILSTAAISAGLGVQVVPVAGQIIGGLLVAAGAAGSLYSSYKEGQKQEADAKAFLEAGGYSPRAAEAFNELEDGRNVGYFLNDVARQAHLAPEKLREKINTMSKEDLETFVYAANQTPRDDKGQSKATDATPGKLDTSTSYNAGYSTRTPNQINSLADAVTYLRQEGVPI